MMEENKYRANMALFVLTLGSILGMPLILSTEQLVIGSVVLGAGLWAVNRVLVEEAIEDIEARHS